MNFIEAVIKISKRPDLEFCDDPDELNGIYSCICIFKGNDFIGKLRWPKNGRPAEVDGELEDQLEEVKKIEEGHQLEEEVKKVEQLNSSFWWRYSSL